MTKVLQSQRNAGRKHNDRQTINKTTPHAPLTAIENLAKPVPGGNHCLPATSSSLARRDRARIARQGPVNGSKKAKFRAAQSILPEICQISPKLADFYKTYKSQLDNMISLSLFFEYC
jgi:hypothetical protein